MPAFSFGDGPFKSPRKFPGQYTHFLDFELGVKMKDAPKLRSEVFRPEIGTASRERQDMSCSSRVPIDACRRIVDVPKSAMRITSH
jgi:hypothetical protein